MSIFSGIVARNPDRQINDAVRAQLERTVTRRPGAAVQVFQRADSCFVSASFSSTQNEWKAGESPDTVAFVAGIPYFQPSPDAPLDVLTEALLSANYSALSAARGVFCGCVFDYERRTLSLVTDRLGIRPIYVWLGPEFVVFATALRILEELDFVPTKIDLRGAAETVAFGFPLAERTGYEDIITLREAEIFTVTGLKTTRDHYYRWDHLPIAADKDALAKSYELFGDAVNLRLGGATEATAYLSGGMDSRSIVAILGSLNAEVTAFNYAPPGTQDAAYAEAAAKALGVKFHHRTIVYDGTTDWAGVMADSLDGLGMLEATARDSAAVWSGDGGSVSVGSVYLEQAVIDEIRTGNTMAAINLFVKKNHIDFARKVLSRRALKQLDGFIETGIREETERLDCADPGHSLHLFLMFNDQRRHLQRHFENVDIHRVEFHLPFFDSEFLQLIFSLPIDYRLAHRFYTDWFKLFPASAQSVPWQTYPGHIPCPISSNDNVTHQWSKSAQKVRPTAQEKGTARYEKLRAQMAAPWFPDHYIDRRKLMFAALLDRLGLRDAQGAMRVAASFEAFARHSNKGDALGI